MKPFLIFLLIFFCAFISGYGQMVQGTIKDVKGQPLPDVYLMKNGSQIHTHTNQLGQFRFSQIQVGDTLSTSYIGFEDQAWIIREEDLQKDFNIVLKEKAIDLSQVTISSNLQTLNQISKVDLELNPVNSAQEVLRKVPGLFIAQHAGGGKAEQIFLRGFDIDHGTDINITVDGLPVNMVSHAHGQGYADLHFIIPEIIDQIDFGKGPYYGDKGNFTTAGYVEFRTKNQLENSSIGLEYGQFNTLRTIGLFDLMGNQEHQHAYLAGEYILTDGPFDSPQHFNRVNLFGKYTLQLPDNSQISLTASHFQSKWDASGQIPQRAVNRGLISRFGAIDDTEGGQTSRTNVALHHTKSLNKETFIKSSVYFSQYDFELFSNFTFFLEDPENGDQIRQVENRSIFGMQSVLNRQFQEGVFDFNLQAGIGLRYDAVKDNELSHTLNRRITLDRLALGEVNETNIYGFLHTDFEMGKVTISPALRLDFFKFDYVDALQTEYQTLSETKTFVSPKLNILYRPTPEWQLFLKSGIGFHSNDTRVVVAQQGEQTLPAAYGIDAGFNWKPLARLWVNSTLWYLFSEQEFVYVGDAGIVEPSGRSQRLGVELGLRAQLLNWLFVDADLNYTYARAIDETEGLDYIPLAPDLTATGGFSIQHPNGFSGGLRYRYIKNRPANEDNSIIAKGYFITDANLNYALPKITFGIVIENIFNTAWNEAQFATESRLFEETEAVEELHFTPGVPFFLKGRVTYKF